MKQGTMRHPKTLRLARILDIDTWGAYGLVCSIKEVAVEYARAGDIGRLSNEEIAHYVGWRDDPGKLIGALLEAGWLERCETHRLVVHDWSDHAEAWVRKSLDRNGLLFCDGSSPHRRKKPVRSLTGQRPVIGSDLPSLALPSQDMPRQQQRAAAPPVVGPVRKKRSAPTDFPPVPPEIAGSSAFLRAWEEWVAHRQDKRKPLTPRSVSAQFKLLLGMEPAEAIAAIEHSIASGYLGIFPAPAPKFGQQRKPPPLTPEEAAAGQMRLVESLAEKRRLGMEADREYEAFRRENERMHRLKLNGTHG